MFWGISVRFDMNHDIGEAEFRLEEAVFDGVGDAVAVAHAAVAGDTDVQVGQADETALAHPALFHAGYPGDLAGGGENFLHFFGGDLFVQDVAGGSAEHFESVPYDQPAGEQGRPVVRRGPCGSAEKCQRNAESGGEGSEGVGAVVEGIDFHGAAADFSALETQPAKEALLDEDGGDQDDQGEGGGDVFPGGCRVLVEDFPQAVNAEGEAREQEKEGSCHGGQGFHFPVTVGVFVVRRAFGVFDGTPHHARTEDVEGGLDAIGQEGVGASENAAEDLGQGEKPIGADAGQNDPPPLAGAIAQGILEGRVGHVRRC